VRKTVRVTGRERKSERDKKREGKIIREIQKERRRESDRKREK
jgi:hypothetical protein